MSSISETHTFSARERRAAISLAMVYALRMLGLFMILPVFALYADRLQGMTPFLMGVAIGVYGLTQAALQIPFGTLSDRYGRKRIIIIGLILFGLGSILAASSTHIYGVILGRALQGAGAIAAAIMALAADLSRESQRTKMMAIIGMSIGAAFVFSLVLGPVLYSYIGVPGIFVLTAVLAFLGMMVVAYVVPNPQRLSVGSTVATVSVWQLLQNQQLLALNIGVFILHLILTASFVVIPIILRDFQAIPVARHWLVYLSVLMVSLLVAMPGLLLADRLASRVRLMQVAIILLVLAGAGLAWFTADWLAFAGALTVFFIAFNLLEATLPSELSKRAPTEQKGKAMGVYSTSQFAGAFMGGSLGGALLGSHSIQSVFIAGSLLALIWLIISCFLQGGTESHAAK